MTERRIGLGKGMALKIIGHSKKRIPFLFAIPCETDLKWRFKKLMQIPVNYYGWQLRENCKLYRH